MPDATTHSPKETEALGARVGTTLQGGEVLGITGPLGAGKTAFVRGLLRGFGMKKPVTSPTFTLAKPYHVPHPHIQTVVHIDAYRLEKPEELLATDVMDIWGRPDTITLIEWPERAAGVLPKKMEYISIDRGKENLRFWTFEKKRKLALAKGEKKTT